MSATLAQLLAASRTKELRDAVVASFKPLFPCEVRAHLGRLDMSDVEDGTMFAAPSLNVAVTRLGSAEGRMSGYRDVPVDVGIYIVTVDQPVPGGLPALRDEIGLALCDGVLAVLEDPARSRWGLDDIGPAEEPQAIPLFTARSRTDGKTYYAVTWRQVLYTLGSPFLDLESAVQGNVTALLPGDSGWVPPGQGGAP